MMRGGGVGQGPSTMASLGGGGGGGAQASAALAGSNAAGGGGGGGNNGQGVAFKVSEVLITAAHAFQRLGDLTQTMQHVEDVDMSHSRWDEEDIDRLKVALTNFSHELGTISENVQRKMTKQIGLDIKRKSMPGAVEERRGPATGSGVKRVPPAGMVPLSAAGLAAKRIAATGGTMGKAYPGPSLGGGGGGGGGPIRLTSAAGRLQPTGASGGGYITDHAGRASPLGLPQQQHYMGTRGSANNY